MSNERDATAGGSTEVPRDEWPSWCARTTSDHGGRDVVLRRADRVIGEVRLADGQPLVSIEHDEFGKTETLTIKCGSNEVPVNYVVAEPQSIEERHDEAGEVRELTIIDTTGRRTMISLA
jgi:hypothetical protein